MTDEECPEGGTPNTLLGKEGYLSSHIAQLTGCGSIQSPWRIKLLPGQQVRTTLIDFTGNQEEIDGSCSKPLGQVLLFLFNQLNTLLQPLLIWQCSQLIKMPYLYMLQTTCRLLENMSYPIY